MKNYIQDGDVLSLTAPAGGVVSGSTYKIGDIICVAVADAAVGETFQGKTEGVFDLPVAAADTPTVGAIAYWDDTNKEFTVVSTSNTKAGLFVTTKDASDNANIKLTGQVA